MPKLADQYTPSLHRIPHNVIYRHYQLVIDKAFRYPGDFKAQQVDCTPERYRYELTEDEEQFYGQLYVCMKPYPTGSGDLRLAELFGDQLDHGLQVGEYEKDLIDFLKAKHQLLYLVAPVGWGKTVLMKYVWFYLINKSKELSETVLPIYISVDTKRSAYENLRSSTKIRKVLWEEQLKSRLTSILAPFIDVNDEELWEFLIEESGNYAHVGVFERALETLYSVGSEEYIKRRTENRMKQMEAKVETFYLSVLKYLTKTKNVVLVLDNVDPLNSKVHEALLSAAVDLTEDYGVRVMVSLRRRTFQDLAADPGGTIATYPQIVVELDHKSFDEYIKKRIELANTLLEQKAFEYIDIHGKRLSPGTVSTVIKNVLRYTLSQECQDVLDLVSYHNLRKVNVLLKVYLSSGYIEDSDLIWSVIEGEALPDTASESPLWVMLTSILTANHETHFSTECPNPRVLNSIINLYCNSGRLHNTQVLDNDHLIRFHVLSYFRRNPRTSVRSLVVAYRKLYRKAPKGIGDALCHAVRRMLQTDIIESPDRYHAERLSDCLALRGVMVTDKGNYFYERFSSYFEYLCYMKDDINRPFRNSCG